ncbi:helix-turn-helix transcriptional regulator [Salinimicrobium sp. TH3]|uniref:helix-turn-helix transcriptional regulator n=1 Tax=Salinimicrobium sp. TH3 TaxID=2997342 RepID=UPI002275EE03|nr:helix-turn-helix domain-containing protein [Salinimicrobium sp. TH3]MCY2687139.1 helix-turn-helix domain-containing protein [Salinimicrobium sp. TH3]
MVNVAEFTNRLNEIMEYYDLSAASFADKIEVGRSSISHLLSGRNKPSLDFVMKIVTAFPDVELYWLLNGKGSFPKKNDQAQVEKPVRIPPPKNEAQDLFSSSSPLPSNDHAVTSSSKKIKKVVILYTDGSFDAYEN